MTMKVFQPIGSVRSASGMSARTTSMPGPKRSRAAHSSPSSKIATLQAQRALAGLDSDPHRSAAHQAGVPREVLGELVLAQRSVAVHEHPLGLHEGVALDAAAAERAGEPAQVVDQELRAHHLRGAPDSPDDGAHRETPSLALKLCHTRVDLTHR